MTWYADLSPCDYFIESGKQLVAIGWLDADHEFTRGQVGEPFYTRLVELLVDPWQPVITAGIFRCPLCRFTGGPGELRYEHNTIQVGAANLFIPADGFLYVAPSLIAHYIDSHAYSPPDEFRDAVLRCPPMRSMSYLRAIHLHGPRRLWRGP